MKAVLIAALVKTPVWIFIGLVLCVAFFEIGDIKILSVTLILLTLAVLLYFMLFYGITRKRNIFRQKIKNNQHTAHQVKVVIIEELIWRYLPFKLLIAIDCMETSYAMVLILTFVFTVSHFIGKQAVHVFIFLEMFAFFSIVFAVFILVTNILVLFIPHFLRNIIIQEMKLPH